MPYASDFFLLPEWHPAFDCLLRISCAFVTPWRLEMWSDIDLRSSPLPPPPEISPYTTDPDNRATSPYHCAPYHCGAPSPTTHHRLTPSCPIKRARSFQARLLTPPPRDRMGRPSIIRSSMAFLLFHARRPRSHISPKELYLRGDLARDRDMTLFTHLAIPYTVIRPQTAW